MTLVRIKWGGAELTTARRVNTPGHARLCLVVALVMVTVVGMAGCGRSECSRGEARCDGSIAKVCRTEEDGNGGEVGLWLIVANCAGLFCTVANGNAGQARAFCALSSTPDGRCVDADVHVCDGPRLVSCTGGYATAETACASGCVALDDHADRCGEDPAGDPLCETDGSACEESFGSGRSVCHAGPAPVCTEGGCGSIMPVPTQVHSFRCQNHALVERTRCASGCAFAVDCSTHCL